MLYDSIYMKCSGQDEFIETDWYFWEKGRMESDCQWEQGFFWGWWKCSGIINWWWLYNYENILKTTKLCTLKRWILWYYNYFSVYRYIHTKLTTTKQTKLYLPFWENQETMLLLAIQKTQQQEIYQLHFENQGKLGSSSSQMSFLFFSFSSHFLKLSRWKTWPVQ